MMEYVFNFIFNKNSSLSVQMIPHDINVKSEGYLLDTLRCFLSITPPISDHHYKCMIPDRYPTDKIH